MTGCERANPVFHTTSAVPLWAAIVASTAALTAAQGIGAVEAAWIAVGAVLLAAIPRRVEIGAEGLKIAWLGPSRLVRYESVRRAEPYGGDGVRLTLEDGETVRLVRGAFDPSSPREALERLWRAVALGAEAGVRPNERAALARGGRSPAAWLDDLRALTVPGGLYRQGIVTVERLLAIATNPAVDVEVRGAAAVAHAFAGANDEPTRDELRAIASLTVDDTLGTVLEKVADARTPDDLADALRELV